MELLNLPEGASVEYKREIPADFLDDIIAFANGNGGTIVCGIIEKDGITNEVVGIMDVDREIQRIENSLRDNIEPRLDGCYTINRREIDSKTLIVINIQSSWNKPHAIKNKTSYKAFVRNNIGKSPMDFMQIRQMAVQSSFATQALRDFRSQRLNLISEDQASVVTSGKSKIVLHLLPLISTQDFNFDVTKLASVKFDPFQAYEVCPVFNFDGCVYLGKQDDTVYSYAQVYRNGCIECVDSYYLSNNLTEIDTSLIERGLIDLVCAAINLLKDDVKLFPPAYICLSILNVKGKKVPNNNTARENTFPSKLISQDHLIFPEFMINSFNLENIDLLLKERIFDQLWQASGHQGSMNFKDGKFVGNQSF